MHWNPKVYLKAFDVGLQDTFVYRWNFFLRSIFELLPLMGTVLIWGVVFDQRKEGVGGFDFKTVVAYFLIVLFLDGLVTPKDHEFRVAAHIRACHILAFLRAFFQDIVQVLTFAYDVLFPVRLVMNRVHGADLWLGLGVQAFWVVVAAAAAQMMWR